MKIAGMCLAAVLSISALAGCGRSVAEETTVARQPELAKYTECREPRPEICYEIYAPVCATRDTGIRCITTPCPSTEQRVYSNDCTACADPKVIGYHPGKCPPGVGT